MEAYRLRTVYCGTGIFGLATLRALAASRHEVAAVSTQPDRRTGRARRAERPIADEAAAAGIAVLEPTDCNDDAFAEKLRDLAVDVVVLVAYGQWIGKALLSIPRFGWINLHASLLPAYRGAAPIAYALMDGRERTGVSVIQIVPRMDAGEVLGQASLDIGDEEALEGLQLRLGDVGADLVLRVLDDLEAGREERVAQDESLVSSAPRLRKEQGRIDWARNARAIVNIVRACTPWPGAQAGLAGGGPDVLPVLIRHAKALDEGVGAPGEVTSVTDEGIEVACGEGALLIKELQPAGRRRMTVKEFINGHPVEAGDLFVGGDR